MSFLDLNDHVKSIISNTPNAFFIFFISKYILTYQIHLIKPANEVLPIISARLRAVVAHAPLQCRRVPDISINRIIT